MTTYNFSPEDVVYALRSCNIFNKYLGINNIEIKITEFCFDYLQTYCLGDIYDFLYEINLLIQQKTIQSDLTIDQCVDLIDKVGAYTERFYYFKLYYIYNLSDFKLTEYLTKFIQLHINTILTVFDFANLKNHPFMHDMVNTLKCILNKTFTTNLVIVLAQMFSIVDKCVTNNLSYFLYQFPHNTNENTYIRPIIMEKIKKGLKNINSIDELEIDIIKLIKFKYKTPLIHFPKLHVLEFFDTDSELKLIEDIDINTYVKKLIYLYIQEFHHKYQLLQNLNTYQLRNLIQNTPDLHVLLSRCIQNKSNIKYQIKRIIYQSQYFCLTDILVNELDLSEFDKKCKLKVTPIKPTNDKKLYIEI